MRLAWFETRKFIFVFHLAIAILLLRLRFPELFAHFFDAIPFAMGGQTPQLQTGFVGGDHLQVYYNAWKLKESLSASGVQIFADPFNFAAKSRTFMDAMIGLQYFQQVILSYLLPAKAAYNFSGFLLSTAMFSFVSHLLFRSLSAWFWVAALLGVTMGWLPYRLNQVASGHGGGIVAYWIPLYLYGLVEFRARSKQRFALLSAAALFFVTISDEHQGYYLLIASMILLPVWLIQDLVEGEFSFRRVRDLVWQWRYLALGLSLTVGWGFFLDQVVLDSDERTTQLARTFSEIASHSRSIIALFTVRFGENIRNVFFPALVFAIGPIALLLRLRKDGLQGALSGLLRSKAFPFALVFVLSTLLTAGLGSHWSQKTGIYEFFHAYLPYFKYQRVPIKMFAVPALSLAIIFLFAFEWLHSYVTASGKRLAARAVRVALFESLAIPAQQILSSSRALLLDTLKSVSGDSQKLIEANTTPDDILMLYPAPIRMDRYATRTQILSIKTRRRFAQGNQGSPPGHFERIWPRLESDLKELGYTHVLVDLAHLKGLSKDRKYKIRSLEQVRATWREVGCTDEFCLFRMESA